MNKKILILGIGQSNFLNQLYSEVREKTSVYKFYISDYFDLSAGKIEEEYLPYEDIYQFKSLPIKKWKYRKTFLEFTLTRFCWQIILFELSQKKQFGEVVQIVHDFAKAKYRVDNFIMPLEMDVVHIHYCIPQNLREIHFLKQTKIICSFWGSDLLRSTGVSNVFYVKKAMEKAEAITIQTPELAEILFCKYGRKFSSKTEILRFNLGKKILKEINNYRNDENSKTDFKKEYNIPLDKIIVALGHNAFRENNQFLMIDKIRELPKDVLSNYAFILHLGYGGDKKYIDSLLEKVDLEKEIEIVVIHDFFNEREIALLRLVTDLFIQMPISDALSAAMTEVLYCGNTVVYGGWLPYGVLRRNGVYFHEIEGFDELPRMLENFYFRRKEIEAENSENASSIERFFFPDKTTPEWIRIFKELA